MKYLVSLLALMFSLSVTVGCGSPKAKSTTNKKSQSSQGGSSVEDFINELDLSELENQVDELLGKIDFTKIKDLLLGQFGNLSLAELKQLAQTYLSDIDIDLDSLIQKVQTELANLDLSQPGAQEKKARLEQLLQQLQNAQGGLPSLLDQLLSLFP